MLLESARGALRAAMSPVQEKKQKKYGMTGESNKTFTRTQNISPFAHTVLLPLSVVLLFVSFLIVKHDTYPVILGSVVVEDSSGTGNLWSAARNHSSSK